MTPAQFKARKPQFKDVLDPTVQMYLDLAGRMAFDPTDDVVAAWACHVMTLDGLGSDAASQAQKSGTAGYQTIKSGQLTLTRFQEQSNGSTYGNWLQQTPCGQFYYLLLRANRGGPRVALGGGGPCRTAYAKDGWPMWVDNGYPH